jgi:sugar-specific transcriptional regulator TrmB
MSEYLDRMDRLIEEAKKEIIAEIEAETNAWLRRAIPDNLTGLQSLINESTDNSAAQQPTTPAHAGETEQSNE